ncbi:helix-turn-helix domain-containing protein [Natronococcus jeotgali]|uniref:Bacterio-opsin activator HTH domain-containing protein n=1 Tax=Natronococcus jeotgali DSM 18795 TaxID=1227498 RepID=L9WV34_9EURY|nr:helix-turn-helix domain-containing protein [Natronococcus jeotgali]ELY53354.1 bacterio-opsin activator HTH domain-containing protein [Natronococcus jeotgali DSM 18795]
MTSIVNLEISGEGTGLAELVDAVPSLTCEAETAVVSNGRDLWLSGASNDEIEAGLAEASAVEEYALINGSDGEWLYNVEFADETIDIFELVLEEGGTILDASAPDGSWVLNIRVQERNDASSIYEALEDRELSPTIIRLFDTTDESHSQAGLTERQYDTLVAAVDHGYFDIPREVSMQELAAELDISHQALSERLRRAYRSLVTSELDVTPEEAEPAPSPSLSD